MTLDEYKKLPITKIVMEGFIAPRTAHGSDERIVIQVPYEERRKLGRYESAKGKRAVVYDKLSGKLFQIEATTCGFPTCFCDTVATELMP